MKKKQLLLNRVKEKCSIEVEAQECNSSYDGKFKIGDTDIDPDWNRQNNSRITGELENGNQWVWCNPKVTISLGGLKTSSELTECSFDGENEFMESEYFEAMKEECINEIVDKLIDILNTINIDFEEVSENDSVKSEYLETMEDKCISEMDDIIL